ncbi:MAG: DegT/DnrJ/EryC1/StrS family aminotransferase [Acidobacteriia bacterium]|nr:DegT/DnrJ/EryC1/StrS family aminotransferase [Terriglobia bacterium]
MIRYLDLQREYRDLQRELDPVVQRVLASGQYILGREVEQFERRWISYCGAAYGLLVASGTDALTLALGASGAVRPGAADEVITSAHGSPYTPMAIVRAGGRPVFADIDPETWLISPASIERVLTSRTRVIMPVHLYGLPCDLKAILAIAEAHRLVVVEDACQAHGARYRAGRWQRVGTLGQAGAFSFYPTKNLGCYGDAGFITSNDAGCIERARVAANGGQPTRNIAVSPGYNSRGDELQAAILSCKLAHLEAWNECRRKLAATYRQRLRGPGLKFQEVPENCEHVYRLFVVRHPQRNQLRAHLRERGIETMVHYPVALHRQAAFAEASQASLPEAERAVEEVLSLPLNPYLSEAEVARIIEAVNEFAAVTA